MILGKSIQKHSDTSPIGNLWGGLIQEHANVTIERSVWRFMYQTIEENIVRRIPRISRDNIK